MKAVIALSGLAGFLLFGPPIFHATRVKHRHLVQLDRDVVATATVEAQSRCRFEAERNLTASAGLGDLLHVVAGSGSLEPRRSESFGSGLCLARGVPC